MRPSRSGLSRVMVGREDELQQLMQLADAADPRVALIAGEPGVGKSRLVQELITGRVRAADDPVLPVLHGQADPGALSRPFELLLDALDGCTAESDPVVLALLRDIADPDLVMVDRLRAGLEVVRTFTTPGPSIVVFEDLHWADSESVALFERIADLPGRRLLIGTYRPDEVTRRHPVSDLLTRLERRHSITHLRLGRLTLSETSQLLAALTGRAPSYRAADTLYHRTGGNPFFIEELVKARGDDDLDQLCERPLPWNLAEVLRRQVDDLEPRRRHIVEAAAVLGRKVPFDLLAAVTGAGEEELIATLRDLVERGLMVETGEDEFSFRHALTREALREQLLGRQRRRLHELALEQLLSIGNAKPANEAGPDYALIAHHACGAGRLPEMLTAARCGLAAYRAIGSPYQALQLAEMGLEELPDDIELLRGAAEAAWLAGLLDDAHAWATHWFEVAGRASDPQADEERADALRLLTRLAWERGQLTQMLNLADDLRAHIETLADSPARARAFAAVAQVYVIQDRTDDAIRWADRAIAAGEALELAEISLAGQVEKGSALVYTASGVADGVKLLAETADEAERAGQWLLAARALNTLLTANVLTGTPDAHAAMLERMRTDAQRAGFDKLSVAAYLQGRARLAMQRGDLSGALATIIDARRRDAGLLRTARDTDYHGALLAGLALEAGDLATARSVLDGMLAAIRDDPGALRFRQSVVGLAFHLACRRASGTGDLAEPRRWLTALIEAIELTGSPSRDFVGDMVSAGLAAGLGVALLRPLVDRVEQPDIEDGWLCLARAQLDEAEGHHSDALIRYRSVVGLTGTTDEGEVSGVLAPAQRGSAHVGAARCLVALGRETEAREHVRAAEPLLAGWSGWRVADLAAIRGRVGLAPPDAPARQGIGDPLSPREHQVAGLLAEGLTNAELARRLYISPRTAAVHVSNILSKLGLGSRTEVAAWVRAGATERGR